MKKKIRLTENDLHRIVKESVKEIISELDWRTYDNAANKALDAADKSTDYYERERRMNQSKGFKDKSYEMYDKQYNLPSDFQKKMDNRKNILDLIDNGWTYDKEEKKLIPPYEYRHIPPHEETLYEPTQGDLKNASKRTKDALNYYGRKSKYENGKWN